jgi:hypothetical protein
MDARKLCSAKILHFGKDVILRQLESAPGRLLRYLQQNQLIRIANSGFKSLFLAKYRFVEYRWFLTSGFFVILANIYDQLLLSMIAVFCVSVNVPTIVFKNAKKVFMPNRIRHDYKGPAETHG